MPFTKVNNYYVNLDHIYYIEDCEHEYKVYFGGADGETKCESMPKDSQTGQEFIGIIRKHEVY